jgi:hypothetical protein
MSDLPVAALLTACQTHAGTLGTLALLLVVLMIYHNSLVLTNFSHHQQQSFLLLDHYVMSATFYLNLLPQ